MRATPGFRLPPAALVSHEEQRRVYGWAQAYTDLAQAWRPWMDRVAQRLTSTVDLRDDLVQEAMIQLWQMDPARFDLADHRLVRRALVHRMRNALRTDRRARGAGRSAERIATQVTGVAVFSGVSGVSPGLREEPSTREE